jgi:mannitol/fructose-specific phosphotransferase system IIA component (Ntr-type)
MEERSELSNLTDMLTRDMIALRVKVPDWQEAVRAAGKLLVDSGAVEPQYVPAMIRMVEEIGPYIVIAPGIAIPHARPEEGAKQSSLSFVTLDPPVNFGNEHNDPVAIVIAFAAPRKEGHLEALKEVARLLEDSDRVERLKQASSVDEVLEIIREPRS